MKTEAKFPAKLRFLFQPSRYKVAYGGRGGAKSWAFARALLLLGARSTLRIPCAREIQNSIKDSVHKLLCDQIKNLGLESFYEVQKSLIRGANGTEFTFHGLRHSVENIKSLEGADICWIEEAQTVSKSSWEMLIPTIRKPGSEIWVTFNPQLETDETYQRFVVHPPTDAVVRKVNWSDNPWFPDVLYQEMLDCKSRSLEDYKTVWEGQCKSTVDGSIYGECLNKAQDDGRITKVPYDATQPVHTFWDLGWRDHTSVWMVQKVGLEFRVIDFLQDQMKPLAWYISELQKRGYVFGEDWLPHDAKAKQLGSGKSIEELMTAAGRKVRIVPMLDVVDGINAARNIFNQCWFDVDKCADGLHSLRHYRYDVDPDSGQFSRMPLHDWASHAADAFRYFAVGWREKSPVKAPPPRFYPSNSSGAWMGA